jgi:NitT/TauT family transport system permease protein
VSSQATIDTPAQTPLAPEEAPTPEIQRASMRRTRGFSSYSPLLASLAGAGALLVHRLVPNQQNADPTRLYPRLLLTVIIAGVVLAIVYQIWHPKVPLVRRLLDWSVRTAPILAAGVVLLCAWDLITLKLDWLPLPYFPGPDGVLQTLVDDWRSAGAGQPGLAECMGHSLLLLLCGYVTGGVLGIVCGVLIGWYAPARYWGMPVMKIIGPIPATALIPMALMLFPSPLLSAVSLIALAVWFPVTMLTLSGVANTRASYLDVAKTLGAKQSYLVLRVAIPAAMPSIFVGLFMGLGASFLTLIVAEAVGVQAGLGWYIDWARAYSDYKKVYAALVIMSAFFSTIMTLLFKLRDHVLVWQKGTIKW